MNFFTKVVIISFISIFLININSFAQNIDELHLKADSLFDAEQYNESKKLYTEIINIDNKNDSAYNRRANCYNKLSLTDLAISDFNRAIELNPKYSAAIINLSGLYTKQNRPEDALQILSVGIKNMPDSSIFYSIKAYIFNEQKQNDSSLYYYNKAYNLDKTNVLNPYNITLIYAYDYVNIDSALYYAEVACKTDENDTSTYLLKAQVELEFGKFDDAIKTSEKALNKFINYVPFKEIIAEAHLYNEKTDQAIKVGHEILEIDSTNYSAIYIIVTAYMYALDFEKSIEYCQVGIKHYPENYVFYYDAGLNYNSLDNFEESYKYMDLAIKYKEDYYSSYYYKALAELNINTKITFIDTKFKNINQDNFKALDKKIKSKKSDYNYKKLLKTFKATPLKMGFDELFMLYYGNSKQKGTTGYSKSTLNTSFKDRYAEGMFEECIKEAKDVLEKNLTYFPAYDYILASYYNLGDYENFYKYYYLYTGFLHSIWKTGTGATAENALIITSVSDEYAFLSFFGLEFKSQALVNEGGHDYDLMIVDDKENFPNGVFFNIDVFFGKF